MPLFSRRPPDPEPGLADQIVRNRPPNPPLDEIDQLALAALIDHFEPTDRRHSDYSAGARAVVDRIREPIEIRGVLKWADQLEAYLAERGLESVQLRPADLRARAAQLQAELDARQPREER